MKEEWRPITIEVSSEGQIRYLGNLYRPTYKQTNGYRFVQFLVHRLVAIAFYGPPQGEKIFVNHIDGNPLNNQVTNLEWVTPKENASASRSIFRARGERNGGAKLTEQQVREIRTACPPKRVKSLNQLAKEWGVHRATLDHIRAGKTWVSGRTSRGHKKLTPIQVDLVRNAPNHYNGISKKLAQEYGVTESTILCIWRGNTWRHI